MEQARQLVGEAMREAATTDSTDSFPVETFRSLARAGLLAAPLPRELGGIGLGLTPGSTLALLRLLYQLGRGNLVVGRVFEGHYNALLLLQRFGTAAQFRRYAREVVEEHKLFGVWNTEAGDGVKIEKLRDGRYRLRGAKTFATGVGFVARPVVNGARPDGGWQMSVVPMDQASPGVDGAWWQPLGMKATRSFRVDFSGVELAADELIGQPGDYYRQPDFSGGAIRFAAVQLGAAAAIFDETRRYLRDLHRTGDSFQQQRLGEMAIALESGQLWLTGAARQYDAYVATPSPALSDAFLTYANMMRTAICEICERVMALCVKCVGARGLNKPEPFERLIRDLTTYLRQPAPDAALVDVGQYVLKTDRPGDTLWQ